MTLTFINVKIKIIKDTKVKPRKLLILPRNQTDEKRRKNLYHRKDMGGREFISWQKVGCDGVDSASHSLTFHFCTLTSYVYGKKNNNVTLS